MSEDRLPTPREASLALLARAEGLSWAALPDEVKEATTLSLMDTVGVAIAGASSPLAKSFLVAEAEALGAGDSTVLGSERSGPPALAAAVNAFSAEVWEWSHGHYGSAGHISAAVLPAVLAVGESIDAGGESALSSLVAGYEVAGRVGRLMQPQALVGGFLSIGMAGAMGAAFAAGRLIGLPLAELTNAVGIAAFLCARSPVESYAKNIKGAEVARSAEVGVRAANLAAAGFEGSDEAAANLVASFGGADRTRGLLASSPRGYEVLDVYIKPYPSCRFTHAAIEGLARLRREAFVHPDGVKVVTVTISRPAATLCRATVNEKSALWDRQFSLPYLAALTVLEGTSWISNPAALDGRVAPELFELQRRVRLVVDDDLSIVGHAHGAVSEIELEDGSILRAEIPVPLGSPGRPLAAEDWVGKFGELSDYGLLRRFASEFASRTVRESLKAVAVHAGSDSGQAPTNRSVLGAN